MFNWFKRKVELKDNKSIMSSVDNKKGLKIGSEISVPNNFECIIYSKNKFVTSLKNGKYKVDGTTFPSLINSQRNKRSKLKSIKFVAHYVSCSEHKIDIKIKKQKFTITFHIEDKIKFVELMLLYAYKVDNNYTVDYLSEVFYELLRHYNFDYKKVDLLHLKKYGIVITNISPSGNKSSIFNNEPFKDSTNCQATSPIPSNMSTDTSDNTSTNQPESVQASSQAVNTGTSNELAKNNLYICPKCGHSSKFSTTYCIRCGASLDQN